MSLQYIIDGYNVIRHPEFPVNYPKKSAPYLALLRQIRLQRLCGSSKNRVMIVLDGYPDRQQSDSASHPQEIIFSYEETADEKIKRLVEKSANPRNIMVISDDKEIRFFVRARGAKVQAVAEFINPVHTVVARKDEIAKPELSSEQITFINQELKERWLR